ncbi:MAG: CotH kinase family protein [Rikenellaceae bacterium]
MKRRYIIAPVAAALLALSLNSCRNVDYINGEILVDVDDDTPYDESLVDLNSFPDWAESTHSNAAEPNFDEVFPEVDGLQTEVKRIDITISSSNWSTMWSDLSSSLSSSGMMGGGDDLDFTPVWVPCTITYDDTDWYQVGVRFKGNSSLSQTYSSGNYKLSMKLSFDKYETKYPALTNQRFYGFKQLNLNNNYEDESFMREKVATDLFREFGLKAAHTQFCEIYINDTYFGLYTIVEEVDDTVIKSQFSDGSGNCYKPEDDAASFASGKYDAEELALKTNTDNPDYSDVLELYNTLHSSERSSDVEAWKSRLEAAFDVDNFIRWMAVNVTIQNWDSYGNMTHNYYLYNNPSTSQLTWIPWDHNETMQSATGNYKDYEPSTYLTISSSSWPLIRYILNVDEYKAKFNSYLAEFIEGAYEPSKVISTFESYYNLLKESAYGENVYCSFLSKDSEFDSAVSTLKTHVQTRNTKIESYLY